MITLQSVTKTFGGGNGRSAVRALDDVSTTITQGEFAAVIGPSGSGKSTLLFTLGAMMEPSSGAIHFGDTDVYGLSAGRRARLRQREIGFVFQTFNLLPYLTCRDNVAVPAILAGLPRNGARERAVLMLERLGLQDRLNHRPAELSVGERQRVALCRALVNEPKVLLADEPTGNLDPAMTGQVMDLFLELHAQGQTIVLVSHDHALAERAGRVIHLRGGRIDNDRSTRAVAQAS